ncbi:MULTISPECIES: alpha/beta fold hydrolase [Rhodococcus]|uniref:Alpha/beta hydrolase n=1 Tax=Rhodococcus rhodochrous TaxID=1829 RepID=A0AAW4XC97_RHORH|nr:MULTISPECIES: alpha/beta hydrolase [Rhodococcus]MCD2110661.1 alpha/beta hydrolase [Rhodococcus rhodochrous]QHG82733.1 alpha/beta hydrolase [Rhodococcus rhodochrous]QOH57586.1 alpha/beta hydrolase [Rhodococcus rhodochrous]WAL45207.1 alpha/beta hydrolase [Rhodococcus pyridinivorans]
MRSPVLTAAPNGVALAYREFAPSAAAARSVPVLLVHGMGGDGRTWTRFAGALVKAGRRVITVDLRGHGRSGRAASYRFGEFAADVAGLCAHLGVETVDLVGHSLGGHVGSLVAQQNPGLVRRLVLEETPLPLREGDPVPEVPAHRPTPVELWHAATSMALNPRAVTAFDRSMTPSVVAQFHTPNPVWWQHLPSLAAPTLLLRGVRRGSMVDPQLLTAAVEALPSASVQEIGCGHSIHRDRARDFAAAVVPFLTDRSVA